MEHATRTVFPNYFNGSEIVTAGKLADSQAGRLHVEVTASNGQRFVLLKTDVPLEPQQAGRGGGAEGRNHVERLWSYLTLKELLSSWRHSGDEREKQRLGQSARTLAVARGFLTPLTALHLRRRALQTPQLEDARGAAAALGPEPVLQRLRGAGGRPGEQAGPAVPRALPRHVRRAGLRGGVAPSAAGACKGGISVEKLGNGAFVPEMLSGKVSLPANRRRRARAPCAAGSEAPG